MNDPMLPAGQYGPIDPAAKRASLGFFGGVDREALARALLGQMGQAGRTMGGAQGANPAAQPQGWGHVLAQGLQGATNGLMAAYGRGGG